ncbi:hypothetical protein ACHHYP_10260 [Achlya hypogyna]|uniref:Uncharacterized protein n=1 Tax=Achlya hypogyna TaxID=1202772 RepID=A0A1V9YLU1_ACHHY|nr:hypothetical protein ACHHYP_10260 [Achlya hypogyna]
MSWVAPTEPSILSVAGSTYPVFFTFDDATQLLTIAIVCAERSIEYSTTLPDATVSVLATAAKCDVRSQAFKAFLIDNIRLRIELRERAFYFGNTRFHERRFDARDGDLDDPVAAKRVMHVLGDVLRSLGDQRCLHERQIWSSQQLFDTLTKGFEQMHLLASYFQRQDAVVAKLTADFEHPTTRGIVTGRLDNWTIVRGHEESSCTVFADRAIEELEQKLQATAHVSQTLAASLSAVETALKTQLKELEASVVVWQRAFDVERRQHQQQSDESLLHLRKEITRLKDAFGLLNDAHCNTSKQLSNVVNQMELVEDLSDRVNCTSKLVAQLRQDHIDMLPKLQEMYVGEQRREAIAALQQLHVSAAKPHRNPS